MANEIIQNKTAIPGQCTSNKDMKSQYGQQIYISIKRDQTDDDLSDKIKFLMKQHKRKNYKEGRWICVPHSWIKLITRKPEGLWHSCQESCHPSQFIPVELQ